MDTIRLEGQSRGDIGKKVKVLRAQGLTPAVLYGHKIKNINLVIPSKAFEKVYARAGESTLLDLVLDGGTPKKVLVQDVQKDALSGTVIHIDFHEVSMTEKITTEIPLKFIGESKAVKELAGVLVKNMDDLKVECLPSDLVHEIEVDITPLVDFETSIHVKELNIPKGITVLVQPDEVVITAIPPRAEEEPVVAAAAVGEKEKIAQVEVMEKGKKEEEVIEDKK